MIYCLAALLGQQPQGRGRLLQGGRFGVDLHEVSTVLTGCMPRRGAGKATCRLVQSTVELTFKSYANGAETDGINGRFGCLIPAGRCQPREAGWTPPCAD